MAEHKHDYDLNEKVKILFEGMDYWVMPRYRQHYLSQDYERFSLKLIKNYLTSQSTLLDIGAHYGAYSLYAAKKTGSQVIAIEPVIENFSLLNHNIVANKLDNKIKSYNVAASDESGEGELNIPWASDSAGFYEHPLAETIKTQKVKVEKIDNLTVGHKIDFIKIDTEGHEIGVIKGLGRTLADNPAAVLLVEANPMTLKAAGHDLEELITIISDQYEKAIYFVDEDKFMLKRIIDPATWRDYLAEDGYANLFCVPRNGNKFLLYIGHDIGFGGAELAMVDQIEYLRANNYLAHVVLPGPGGIEDKLKELAISHSYAGQKFWKIEGVTKPDFTQSVEASAEIAELAANIKPDLIINNTMVSPWGITAAKLNGLPLAWWVHEYGDLDHGIKFPYEIGLIRQYIIDQSDLVICCSNSVKQVMLNGGKSTKVHALYNALDVSKIEAKAKQKPVSQIYKADSGTRLIIVGRITKEKGQHLAIEAVAKLKAKGIKVQLHIVGTGEPDYVEKLKEIAATLKLGTNVHFLGHQDNPYPYIAAAEVVLTCSVNEAFGRGTAEAMILGKPVIGSNSGGTAELIKEGQTGLLFKPKDADDLANKLERFITAAKVKYTASQIKAHITSLVNREEIIQRTIRLIEGIDYDKDRSVETVMVKEWVDAVLYGKQIRGDLAQSQARLSELEQQNALLTQELANIVNSKSWKITKIARVTSKSAKKIRRK